MGNVFLKLKLILFAATKLKRKLIGQKERFRQPVFKLKD